MAAQKSEAVVLRDVEEQLRELHQLIAPYVSIRFFSYAEPRYRSALRMQLGDSLVLAAVGGVLSPWPNMPDDVSAAGIQIYLETWATVQSGQSVDLVELAPLLELVANKPRPDEPSPEDQAQ